VDEIRHGISFYATYISEAASASGLFLTLSHARLAMFHFQQLLFALLACASSGLADSASTYYGNSFDVGNGDSFGIPGNASFDYIVVGGGTAGLAVAMRLAEDNTHTVAVVEAGGFYQVEAGNKSVTPFYNNQFANINDPLVDPLIDWGFVTTPQPGANN
jgi:choline dehydrogenase